MQGFIISSTSTLILNYIPELRMLSTTLNYHFFLFFIIMVVLYTAPTLDSQEAY